MNGAKLAAVSSSERVDDADKFLRLTLQINHWDQKFLSELAKGTGLTTPAYVAKLIRDRLQEVREAAKR